MSARSQVVADFLTTMFLLGILILLILASL